MTPRVVDAAPAGPNEQLGVLLYDGVTEPGLSGIGDPFVGSCRSVLRGGAFLTLTSM
jgi:hypothetical protein